MWLCLFCLFPSVIINSQIILLLKIGELDKPSLNFSFLKSWVYIFVPPYNLSSGNQ